MVGFDLIKLTNVVITAMAAAAFCYLFVKILASTLRQRKYTELLHETRADVDVHEEASMIPTQQMLPERPSKQPNRSFDQTTLRKIAARKAAATLMESRRLQAQREKQASVRSERAARLATATRKRLSRRMGEPPRQLGAAFQLCTGASGVALPLDIDGVVFAEGHRKLQLRPSSPGRLGTPHVIIVALLPPRTAQRLAPTASECELLVYSSESDALDAIDRLGKGERSCSQPRPLARLRHVQLAVASEVCDVWEPPPWTSWDQEEQAAACWRQTEDPAHEKAAQHWKQWLELGREQFGREQHRRWAAAPADELDTGTALALSCATPSSKRVDLELAKRQRLASCAANAPWRTGGQKLSWSVDSSPRARPNLRAVFGSAR